MNKCNRRPFFEEKKNDRKLWILVMKITENVYQVKRKSYILLVLPTLKQKSKIAAKEWTDKKMFWAENDLLYTERKLPPMDKKISI